ncbi:adrenodoxin [Leptodontidium sp. MPI-SDFR-AT-0119]|nr:adrenodoxin [Leptodontidium sp. MPI-SDFR-AT-0119]
MSPTRTVVGGLCGVGRRSLQCLRTSSGRQSIVQGRASLSTVANQSVAINGFRSQSQKIRGSGNSIGESLGRRAFSATSAASHGHWEPPPPGKELYVTFVDKEGDEHKIAVSEGDNLLTVAQANDIEMEGACEGSCTCSTCHVIVQSEDMFDKIPEADDDENDMLDLAFGLTETSRLGCQITMKPELDGLVVNLPAMTRNMQASDFEKRK